MTGRDTMSVLSREALRSGDFLQTVGVPPDLLWTREQIEASLLQTLLQRPAGPLWVFAYGSLMWNPLLRIDDRRLATLNGWHRSFCLDMRAGRGSEACPGRMLALAEGGATRGLALRLHDAHVDEELRLLWNREMLTGAYRPLWTAVDFDDGTRGTAVTFVIDTTRPQYAADASVATVAPLIASACGPIGSNADYVHRLVETLAEWRIIDDHVDELDRALRRDAALRAPAVRAVDRPPDALPDQKPDEA